MTSNGDNLELSPLSIDEEEGTVSEVLKPKKREVQKWLPEDVKALLSIVLSGGSSPSTRESWDEKVFLI
jgi:hypothetical protein